MESNSNPFTNQDPIESSMSQHRDISIKIKSMDNEFMVDINAQANIEQLKQKIEVIAKVPIDRQRLIFRGRLLKNEESITVSKITHLDVVHLVAKIGDITSQSQSQSQSQPQEQSQQIRTSSILSFMNNIIRTESTTATTGSSLRRNRGTSTNITTGTSAYGTTVNDQNTTGVVQFNDVECKEAIVQSIVQIHSLFECGSFNEQHSNSNDIDSNETTPILNCFDLSKRKLIKGQWVDVKDTVDQWLEAQVIDVKDNSVYIHYNRWGTRWDEWIEMSSDRIMPFRYHTRQSSITNYQSPYPNSKPDANVSLTLTVPLYNDISDIVNDVIVINEGSVAFLKQIGRAAVTSKDSIGSNDSNTKEKRQLDYITNLKQLIPVIDKMGRLYTDISAYMNNAMKKNKFEELNKELFSNGNAQGNETNTNVLLKPYTQDEQKAVNEELINKNSQRTIRSGTLNFIPPSNRLDKRIINQIPLIDTPLTVSNRSLLLQPVLDVYVHTFVYPSTTSMLANRGIAAALDNNNSVSESSPTGGLQQEQQEGNGIDEEESNRDDNNNNSNNNDNVNVNEGKETDKEKEKNGDKEKDIDVEAEEDDKVIDINKKDDEKEEETNKQLGLKRRRQKKKDKAKATNDKSKSRSKSKPKTKPSSKSNSKSKNSTQKVSTNKLNCTTRSNKKSK